MVGIKMTFSLSLLLCQSSVLVKKTLLEKEVKKTE